MGRPILPLTLLRAIRLSCYAALVNSKIATTRTATNGRLDCDCHWRPWNHWGCLHGYGHRNNGWGSTHLCRKDLHALDPMVGPMLVLAICTAITWDLTLAAPVDAGPTTACNTWTDRKSCGYGCWHRDTGTQCPREGHPWSNGWGHSHWCTGKNRSCDTHSTTGACDTHSTTGACDNRSCNTHSTTGAHNNRHS